MLLKRTEKIWNEVCQYAGEENVAEWRVLGLLLTRSSNKDAKRIGQELWTNTKSEGKLPVEPAMTMMMDSKLGRATYNSQREKRMPGISTYYFCYMAFTIISSPSTSKLSISSISGNVQVVSFMFLINFTVKCVSNTFVINALNSLALPHLNQYI